MVEFGERVRKLLQEHGYYSIRQGKGGYDIWYSPLTNVSVTVDKKIKSRFAANSILMQGDIGYRF